MPLLFRPYSVGLLLLLPFNEHRRRYHRIIPTLCPLDRPHLSRHLDNGAAGMPFYIPLFLLLLLSIAAPGCFMPKWVQTSELQRRVAATMAFISCLCQLAGRHLAHKFCLPSASMLASIQQWMGPSPSLQRMSDEKATGPPETHE